MGYTLQIQKLLLQREQMPSPDDRIALLKQAILCADANNDVDWGMELRLELIRDEKYTARCIESLPAFTWILDVFDRRPDEFNETCFLWEYKWMLGALRRNSSIPLERIEIITEDYKQRLQRNGYSLRSYYTVRIHLALFLNRIDEACKYLKLRDAENRDDMANCRACELDDEVELELRRGNLDLALVVGNELLNKKISCGHVPFSCYCTCVEYFRQAGKPELALDYFNKAEAEFNFSDNDTSQVCEVGTLIRFLSDIDREKAWSYFERVAHWNNNSEDYFDFLFSMHVLRLLSSDGARKLNVSASLPWFRPDNVYRLADIYDYYYTRAQRLATQFDTRNGNNCFKKELEKER